MSKKYLILGMLAGVSLLLSFSSNPPNGRTGAPGEGLCSDCHSLNGGTQNGNISITGLPATIIPNTAYTLTMTSSNPNGVAVLAGFQLTILNSGNNIAGNITGASAGSHVESSGGRQYWEHFPAQPYPGSNVVTWTATWTAPSMPPNTTITAYAAGNIANGNSNSTGDLIVTTTASGMLMGGGADLMVSITSSTDVSCFGQSNGSATATATGGSIPYAYTWSNGAMGATASNLAAGTYTVTVTDNAAATATASISITQPTQLNLNTPVINHVSCNGGNNGSITASASGGAGFYFFNWSNGATGATISNLTAGSYAVTVTDDNACTKTATYMVTQPAVINITLVDLNHETCAGAEDGSIVISISGGATPIFAEWSNGSIGNTINNLAPDTYSVTVTDANDCTQTATYTVNPGGTVEVELIQMQHVSCNGGNNGSITVVATGGFPPYTYLWSNGMTGAAITNLTAGNYLVTASDANGCEVIEGYLINQPPAINITINQTSQNLCFGDATADLTAVVNGGVPGYTYLWSNGITTLNNDNLAAGTYTITATDANNCTSTASATVSQPALLAVNVATTDETSAGANDGTAAANVTGGVGPYTYIWNTGAVSVSISNLPPGMYCVTVTDGNGCTATGCGQVNIFGCTIDVSAGADFTFCEGDTVTLQATVSGANGAVSYTWSDGSTNSTTTIVDGGTYCVTVTDEANCQDNDCITVIENSIVMYDCPVTNESLPGANDGAINCDSFPAIVTYLWSNGETTSSISGLAPGAYCVTVTDVAGCTKEQCFNVQPGNCNITVTSTQVNVLCSGDTTGSITLTVNGATAPVSFTWSNGDTGATISNLAAGNYSVTVMDAAGCVETQSFTITEPLPIVITIDSVGPVDNGGDGFIEITVTGGTPPYNYLWTDPLGASYTTQDLSDLSVDGNYAVVVTDASNCTASMDSIFVDMDVAVEPAPKFQSLKVYPVPADDVLFIEIESRIAEVIITGIDGRMIQHIKNPANNTLTVDRLESGWYLLRISDGKNWYIARLVK